MKITITLRPPDDGHGDIFELRNLDVLAYTGRVKQVFVTFEREDWTITRELKELESPSINSRVHFSAYQIILSRTHNALAYESSREDLSNHERAKLRALRGLINAEVAASAAQTYSLDGPGVIIDERNATIEQLRERVAELESALGRLCRK